MTVQYFVTIKTPNQIRNVVGSGTPIIVNGNGFTSSTRITPSYVTGHIAFSEDLGEVTIEAGLTGDVQKLITKVVAKKGSMFSYRFGDDE